MEAEQLIEAPQKDSQHPKGEQVFEKRSVIVPPNRLTPLRNHWEQICETVVKNMKLQIRMNTKKKTIDVRECP